MDNTNFNEINSKENKIHKIEFYMSVILIIIINLFYLYANKKEVELLFTLVKNHKYFTPSMIGLIIWLVVVLILNENNDLKNKYPTIKILIRSTRMAIYALIIATFAYIDIVLPVFWFVLLIHFLSHNHEF